MEWLLKLMLENPPAESYSPEKVKALLDVHAYLIKTGFWIVLMLIIFIEIVNLAEMWSLEKKVKKIEKKLKATASDSQ